MNLPTPTPQEVEEFRALYKAEFGVMLSEQEAWDIATRALQLFYICTYGRFHLQPQESRG